MKKLWIGVWYLWMNSWLGPSLQAQQDTLQVALPSVEIVAPTLRSQSLGSPTQSWEEEALRNLPAHTLADLLGSQTGTFIKSYGLGSLATSSIRGGAAGHTLVL